MSRVDLSAGRLISVFEETETLKDRQISLSRVRGLHLSQPACVCVCVTDRWKNGASWKSSAAVSLLSAARVPVREGRLDKETE